MKKTLRLLLAMTLVVGFALTANAYEALNGPTGVLKYVKGKAMDGYTVFAPMMLPKGGKPKAYMMDNEGYIVHTWNLNYRPSLYVELLENGNLLATGNLGLKTSPMIGGVGGIVQELDWDSNVVWEYQLGNPDEVQHHTSTRMPNGNTLILAFERKTIDEAIAEGRKPDTYAASEFSRGKWHTNFWVDFIREVDQAGNTVWEWHVWDHLGVGPTKININYVMPKPVGPLYWSFDWSHGNTVDYIEETDEVIFNLRNFGEFLIINHKTGDIVWRWGNPCTYEQGECPSYFNDGDQKLFGQHDVSYLGKNVFQIFDNGSERPEGNRSRIVHVNRVTEKVVWEYEAKDSTSFYTYRQGGVQMLANGNMLVTSTHHGHLFEVNKKKQILWEYVSPFSVAADPVCHYEDSDFAHNTMGNMIHRAFKYPEDYPAFEGKTFTRGKLTNDGCPQFWKVYGLDQVKGSKPMKLIY